MISVAAPSFVVGFFRASRGSGLSGILGILAALVMALSGPTPSSAQAGDSLLVHGPDDSSLSLSVRRSRGYATVSHEALRQLGWAIEVDVPKLRARLRFGRAYGGVFVGPAPSSTGTKSCSNS